MFIVIKCSPDGDTYCMFADETSAKKDFMESIDGSNEEVFLLKAETGVEFGFGSMGEVFGAELVDSFDRYSSED